jgi:hypothetical protein
MAQDASFSDFDIDCLRHVVADPEVARASLSAALIKVRALAIAREQPDQRDRALEIVQRLEDLYPRIPDRAEVGRLIGDHLRGHVTGPSLAALGEAMSDALWHLFRTGRH